MAKGFDDLKKLAEFVAGDLEQHPPKTAIDYAKTAQRLLAWLTANGWTLEELSGMLATAVSFWSVVGPLLEKIRRP